MFPSLFKTPAQYKSSPKIFDLMVNPLSLSWSFVHTPDPYVNLTVSTTFSLSWSLVDTPDPCVKLRVSTSPNSRQQTTSKENDKNPEWNETFTFYLNAEKKNTLGMKCLNNYKKCLSLLICLFACLIHIYSGQLLQLQNFYQWPFSWSICIKSLCMHVHAVAFNFR